MIKSKNQISAKEHKKKQISPFRSQSCSRSGLTKKA